MINLFIINDLGHVLVEVQKDSNNVRSITRYIELVENKERYAEHFHFTLKENDALLSLHVGQFVVVKYHYEKSDFPWDDEGVIVLDSLLPLNDDVEIKYYEVDPYNRCV